MSSASGAGSHTLLELLDIGSISLAELDKGLLRDRGKRECRSASQQLHYQYINIIFNSHQTPTAKQHKRNNKHLEKMDSTGIRFVDIVKVDVLDDYGGYW